MKNTRMDWIESCTDAKGLETLMENAKRLGNNDVYWRAFKRRCVLEGLDYSDPLHRDFYATLAAYEQLLFVKNGKRIKANYTRRKIRNKGLLQSLEEWAVGNKPTEGFDLLVANGQGELTGEYLVLRYRDRFSPQAVAAAETRLAKVGIKSPIASVA